MRTASCDVPIETSAPTLCNHPVSFLPPISNTRESGSLKQDKGGNKDGCSRLEGVQHDTVALLGSSDA